MPAYIDHRLSVAGATGLLFSNEACDLIYAATQGTPRLINILCDTALMYGFAKEAKGITRALVQAVIDDKRQHGVFPVGAGVTRKRGRSPREIGAPGPLERRGADEDFILGRRK